MSTTRIPPPLQSLSAGGISPGPSPGRKQSRQPLSRTICPSSQGIQLDTMTMCSMMLRPALVLDRHMPAKGVLAALDGCAQSRTMALLLSKLSTWPRRRRLMHASSMVDYTPSFVAA